VPAQVCHWVTLPFFYKSKNFKTYLLELPACKCHIDRHTSVKFKVKLCFNLPIYIFIVFHLADHVADFWITVKFFASNCMKFGSMARNRLWRISFKSFPVTILFQSYIYIWLLNLWMPENCWKTTVERETVNSMSYVDNSSTQTLQFLWWWWTKDFFSVKMSSSKLILMSFSVSRSCLCPSHILVTQETETSFVLAMK